MSEAEAIVRIAAKGDGVSESGRHVPYAATGDRLLRDGTIQPGPHHRKPPCRHFERCGGCQLQHCDDAALRDFVTDRVVNVAAGQDLAVEELLPTYLSPPQSRRRATLHGLNTKQKTLLGYREAGSHRIVDVQECPVLCPEFLAILGPLRRFLGALGGRSPIDVSLTLVDQGLDCLISGVELEGLGPTEAALDFARDNGLARLTIDMGFGAEAMWEPEPVTITFAGVAVPFPAGAFLQPTRDGENVLVEDVRSFLEDSTSVADLFSGLGTFALSLAKGERKVLAAEAARDAHFACRLAASRGQLAIECAHRDLFRNPLQPEELRTFDGVVLDPPRAGAREQIAAIAKSDVASVAYVSCNPSSWARDARVLVEAGFRLQRLRPVGQFRWSTHVELTSLFVR